MHLNCNLFISTKVFGYCKEKSQCVKMQQKKESRSNIVTKSNDFTAEICVAKLN